MVATRRKSHHVRTALSSTRRSLFLHHEADLPPSLRGPILDGRIIRPAWLAFFDDGVGQSSYPVYVVAWCGLGYFPARQRDSSMTPSRASALLESLRIPRWLGGGTATSSLEVHGFADASARAYAAVLYLKTITNGRNKVSLIAAKSKVAPLKPVSLPRLELSQPSWPDWYITRCHSSVRNEPPSTFGLTLLLPWAGSEVIRLLGLLSSLTGLARSRRRCPTPSGTMYRVARTPLTAHPEDSSLTN